MEWNGMEWNGMYVCISIIYIYISIYTLPHSSSLLLFSRPWDRISCISLCFFVFLQPCSWAHLAHLGHQTDPYIRTRSATPSVPPNQRAKSTNLERWSRDWGSRARIITVCAPKAPPETLLLRSFKQSCKILQRVQLKLCAPDHGLTMS